MLARLLVGAAVAWPLVAGAALWQRALSPASLPAWAAIVYAGAGRVCHQRSERSFHTHDVAWPVCARCAGLYLAAPFAAVLAFRRRSLKALRLQPLWLVAVAAVPTAVTLIWEWGDLGTPSNLLRFATALPLGAAVAFVLIATVSERQRAESIE
ncbi:MAG: DUF2085 domain-containing protein [Vicinamibacterales bacterium]